MYGRLGWWPETAPCVGGGDDHDAYEVVAKHADLFDAEYPADAFIVTDNFMSAGRISGALSIPIPQLMVGQFHTVSGSRLQDNEWQLRYRKGWNT
jgi:chromosome partitioning protein